MPNGTGLDHWFWGQKISAGSERGYGPLPLSNIAGTAKNASVRVYLHGHTNDPAESDHKTRVTLNGNILGDVTWDGQKPIIYTFEALAKVFEKEVQTFPP
jgi:hypothetical protein